MLRHHQLEGVSFLIDHRGGIVADEMGTGKTRLSLAYAKWLIVGQEIDRVLVVCPASLLTNWQSEVQMYLEFNPYTFKSSKAMQDNWVTLISYQTLRQKTKHKFANLQKLKDHFKGKKLLVILDEAHWIKNMETATTQTCNQLPATFKVAMTGTPISNKPEDLASLLHFTDPTFDINWFNQTFIIRQMVERRNRNGWRFEVPQVVGYKNQDQLHELLKPRMIRRLKKDCVDLPKKNVIYLPYELNDTLYNYIVNLSDTSDETMMVKIMRLQQAASGLNPFDETKEDFRAGAKYKLLKELLNGYDGRKVIWFKYYETLKHFVKLLRLDKHDVYEWHGRNRNTRDQQRLSWSTSDGGILAATIGAAREGLNFVEGSTAIIPETELSPAIMHQVEDRIHRIGQTEPTNIIYLYGQQSVEEAIIHLLRKKAHLNRCVVDGFTPDELRQIYRYSFRLGY